MTDLTDWCFVSSGLNYTVETGKQNKQKPLEFDILGTVSPWVQSKSLYFFCVVWRYKITVTLSGKSKVRGYVNVALYGEDGNTKQYQITK